MSPTKLLRVDPSRNMSRFYEIDLQPGLFGDASVMRHWGRIGQGGQSREYWFDDETGAQKAADAVLNQKRRRGYKHTLPYCE